MAVTFRGSATGSVFNGGTVTIDLTGIAGLAENDIVVVCAASSAGTASTPAGWTLLLDREDEDENKPGRIFVKTMTASPDTSVSFWDTGGTGDSGAAVALAFTGAAAAGGARDHLAGSGALANPPPITLNFSNSVVAVFEVETAGAADSAHTAPTNYATEATDFGADTVDTVVAGTYRIMSGGGASIEDPGAFGSWDIDGDSRTWAATLEFPSATVTTTGVAAPTIAAFTSVATATGKVTAASTPTIAALTSVATATVLIVATATPTMAAFTAMATNVATVTATATPTIAAFTSVATATGSAVAAPTIGPFTSVATIAVAAVPSEFPNYTVVGRGSDGYIVARWGR